MQLRHDTRANWTDANPRLLAGEFAYETDTNRVKLGNGTSRWLDLPYFPSDTGLGSVFDGGAPDSNYGTIPDIIDCGGVT